MTSDVFGSDCSFESFDASFERLGIRIQVVLPGRPSGLYHREDMQEDFLVLAGECVLLVEGEERRLQAWDFFDSPPNTEHIFVGAGDRPCVILMTGARSPNWSVVYPVSELASRHGAGVEVEATSPRDAYASYPEERLERPPRWDELPWA